jgi:hypothetical protein
MKEIYFADKFSLKLKILILCLAGSFSIFIISIIFAFFNFNSQEDLIKERMYQSAEDLSNSIQDQFYERYGDAKTFALYFKNISGYSKEEVNYLNKLVKFYGFYDLILVCDLNGKLIVTNDENANGKKINSEILYKENFSQTNWFKETLAKRYSEDAAKGFTQVNIQKPDFNEIIEKVYKEKILNKYNLLKSGQHAALKLSNGEEVSKECADIFEQILINTEEVNTLVYEITNSTKEQAKGIYKINNAMHELDHVTNQNNNIAEKTTQTAHELLKQSNELEAMANSLMEIINGNGLNILEKVEG